MPINETMQPDKFAQDIIDIAKKRNPNLSKMEPKEIESIKAYWKDVGKAIKDYVSSAKITAKCDSKDVTFYSID